MDHLSKTHQQPEYQAPASSPADQLIERLLQELRPRLRLDSPSKEVSASEVMNVLRPLTRCPPIAIEQILERLPELDLPEWSLPEVDGVLSGKLDYAAQAGLDFEAGLAGALKVAHKIQRSEEG